MMLAGVKTAFQAADFAHKRAYWFQWDDKAHAEGHAESNWIPDGFARLYIIDDPRFNDTLNSELARTPEAKLAREVGALRVFRVSRWIVYHFKHTSNATAARPRVRAHYGNSEQGFNESLPSEQQRGNFLVVEA
jgi:hypothetical protein